MQTVSTTLMAWTRDIGRRLEGAGLECPEATAEWLVAERLGCSRSELPVRRDKSPSPKVRGVVEGDLERLMAGEPLQYVLGNAPFMDLMLRVDPRVLIPRPETEELAGYLIDRYRYAPPRTAADIGTGSGCLALALARAWPQTRIWACDVSPDALAVARENAGALGLADRVTFRQTDLLNGFAPASLDLVASNPPYIPTVQWAALPVWIREHEPRLALDGGDDGLRTIEPLIEQARAVLVPGGRLILEMSDDQAGRVSRLMGARGFAEVRVLRDAQGRDRFAEGRTPWA